MALRLGARDVTGAKAKWQSPVIGGGLTDGGI